VPRYDLGAIVPQEIDQMAAGEPRRARDEYRT
jgi:hypothetical protein